VQKTLAVITTVFYLPLFIVLFFFVLYEITFKNKKIGDIVLLYHILDNIPIAGYPNLSLTNEFHVLEKASL
jgi:hypothetical protein